MYSEKSQTAVSYSYFLLLCCLIWRNKEWYSVWEAGRRDGSSSRPNEPPRPATAL